MSQEKFDYLRTDFLSMLGHDLRSPAGAAWTALTELNEPSEFGDSVGRDLKREKMLLIARRGVRRVLRMADRISMTAELERGPLVLELAPIALREFAVSASADASELIARKGVVVDVIGGEELSIEADVRWLGPTEVELVANALRHARTSVRVTVSIEGELACILVEDDGRGFAPDFSLADRARFVSSGAVGGIGLSLCMANDVARAHGGRMFAATSSLPAPASDLSQTRGAAVGFEVPFRR